MEKNSVNYKAAQTIANNITAIASSSRNYHMGFERDTDALGRFCEKVACLDCFAAEVAKTVNATIGKGFAVARVSSKQAWILACAAVENNIELKY